MSTITKFKNYGYGEYVCCVCNTNVLNGWHTVYGDQVNDDEGYEWRGVCNCCLNKVKHLTPTQVYNQYNTNELK